MVKENCIDGYNCRDIKKSENKIVQILVKSWNMFKIRSENWFKSKSSIKIQNISIIREFYFPISDAIIVFTKLR